MTRILIDHGAASNLGDAAMVYGVVRQLQALFSTVKLNVVNRWRGEVPFSLPREVKWHPPGDVYLPVVTHPLHFLQKRINAYLRRSYGISLLKWDSSKTASTILDSSTNLGKAYVIRHGKASEEARIQAYCQPFDGLHIVGGGYLAEAFLKVALRRMILMQVFLMQGKPVILTGQQLGPFTNKYFERTLAHVLQQTTFIGLREPTDSVKICQASGIDEERYEIMGDDSFGLMPDALGARALLDELGVSPSRFIAANLRYSQYASNSEADLDKVAAVLDALSRHHSMPIVIVPIALGEEDSDIKTGYRIQERSQGVIHVLGATGLSPSIVKGVLGFAYGAVGMSYHFCTFALEQGTPTVCLYAGRYYRQKAKGIRSFWEDDRLGIDLQEKSVTALVDHVQDVLKDESLRSFLVHRGDVAQKRWERIFRRATSIGYGSLS